VPGGRLRSDTVIDSIAAMSVQSSCFLDVELFYDLALRDLIKMKSQMYFSQNHV
jgi:hypothetical protein